MFCRLLLSRGPVRNRGSSVDRQKTCIDEMAAQLKSVLSEYNKLTDYKIKNHTVFVFVFTI